MGRLEWHNFYRENLSIIDGRAPRQKRPGSALWKNEEAPGGRNQDGRRGFLH